MCYPLAITLVIKCLSLILKYLTEVKMSSLWYLTRFGSYFTGFKCDMGGGFVRKTGSQHAHTPAAWDLK